MLALRSIFTLFKKEFVESWAQTCGFIKRQRSLTALDFLILMTFGQASIKHPSLSGMVGVLDACITREALHYRFTDTAVSFLKKCLQFALQQKLAIASVSPALLEFFPHLLIVDSSSWDIASGLRHILPGSGGGASQANCKIQLGYEYKRGEFSFFEITPGTLPDNRYTDNLISNLAKNDLLITDLGYFKLSTFWAIHEIQAFFLSRLMIGTNLRNRHTHLPIDLEKLLTQSTQDIFEIPIEIGKPSEMETPCRLICLRVDESVANRRRSRIHKEAKKKAAPPAN